MTASELFRAGGIYVTRYQRADDRNEPTILVKAKAPAETGRPDQILRPMIGPNFHPGCVNQGPEEKIEESEFLLENLFLARSSGPVLSDSDEFSSRPLSLSPRSEHTRDHLQPKWTVPMQTAFQRFQSCPQYHHERRRKMIGIRRSDHFPPLSSFLTAGPDTGVIVVIGPTTFIIRAPRRIGQN